MARRAFLYEKKKYIFFRFLQTEKFDEPHLTIDEIRCNFIYDLFRHDISLEKKRYTSNQYFDTRLVEINNTKNELNCELQIKYLITHFSIHLIFYFD